MKKIILFFMVVCSPPVVPGAVNQPNGMHRGGRFWSKGISYAKIESEEQLAALQRDKAFELKQISEKEFEEHQQAPQESDGDKLARLVYENVEALKAMKELGAKFEQALSENQQLRERISVLEQRTQGL